MSISSLVQVLHTFVTVGGGREQTGFGYEIFYSLKLVSFQISPALLKK